MDDSSDTEPGRSRSRAGPHPVPLVCSRGLVRSIGVLTHTITRARAVVTGAEDFLRRGVWPPHPPALSHTGERGSKKGRGRGERTGRAANAKPQGDAIRTSGHYTSER